MLEQTILAHLTYDDNYCRKVIPYLKVSYFQDHAHRLVYTLIHEYVNKYNKLPTKDSLLVDLTTRSQISEDEFKGATAVISAWDGAVQDIDWLLDQTEKFCQDRAIYNAIYQSIQIMDDKKEKKPRTVIPDLLQEALAVSFDSHIGHDYIQDAEKRWDFFHQTEHRVPFDLEMLNTITDGGLKRKTLNVIAGGVGFGKTQMMCHFAAANLTLGKNVLYITLEMSEEEIANRIDANLIDVELEFIQSMDKPTYLKRITNLRDKTVGRLIIHEYPTGQAGSANFRHLLHELKIKHNFVPDILYVDYLNICASSRIQFNGRIGLYEYVKMIAEELRGLAVEHNIPVFSATQVNREGFKSSDPGMDNTAESFGLPATVDMLLVIIQSDDLHQLNQVMIKQLKNRYSDFLKNNRFVVGVNRSKMKLFDVEKSAQYNVVKMNGKGPAPPPEDKPVFDQGSVQDRIQHVRGHWKFD